MAAAGVGRAEVVGLLRSLIRTSRQFNDYNIREYVKRRSVDAFRGNKSLTDASAVAEAFTDGKAQLEVAKRQAVVYGMYAPEVKSVMEIIKKV